MHALSKPDLLIAAGAPVILPPGAQAWRVEAGRIEAYLTSAERRRLIAVVEAGGHVFGVEAGGLAISLVACEGARLAAVDDAAFPECAEAWLRQAGEAAGLAQSAMSGADAAAIAAFTASLDGVFVEADAARDRALAARLGVGGAEGREAGPVVALRAAALQLGGAAASLGAPPAASDFTLTAALARRFGLRASRVVLPQGWSTDDRGPLLLQARGGDTVTFAQWGHRGYAGTDGAVVREAAYDSLAFRLYRPLPARFSRLAVVARSVLRDLAGEWRAIIGAALGTAVLGLVAPVVTGWVFDAIVPGGERGLIAAAGFALIGAALAGVLLSAARALAISRVRGRGETNMIAGLSDHVLRLPARFFRTHSAGDLAQRLSGVEAVRGLVADVMLGAGLTAIFALLYLVQLFTYDVRLALAGLGLTLVYAAATAISRRLQLRPLRLAAERGGMVASLTYELMEGIAKLRTAAAETRMLARWQAAYAGEREAAAASDRIGAHFAAFADSWNVLTVMGLFATAALLAHHSLSAGGFIAFFTAFSLFQVAFNQLCGALMALWHVQPLADRARPILEAEPEARMGRADPGQLAGHISVSGLSFAYDGARAAVIDGLDFEVWPGEHLAIVGGSGSGKSTILRLLLGFETPLTGSITYDGQDFASLDPARVRAQIGVVLQSSQLFAGSIQDNIKGAAEATLEQCLGAAEAAGLAGDLKQFPMGVHTLITEGAGTLSGGQRQRILIARALAGSPRILFLDEATSALDNSTQAVVAATMDTLHATRITIAHRLSTVRKADRIAVLEGGSFVEVGDFATLMARNGAFAALAKRQLLEE